MVDGSSECDDANVDPTDWCLPSCVHAYCGDGVVNRFTELCDSGTLEPTAECATTCTLPTCGNAQLDPGEQCDDGNVFEDDACLTTCVIASCGDGFVRAGVPADAPEYEECDDRGPERGSNCTDDCKLVP